MSIVDGHLHVASEEVDGRPVVDGPKALALMNGPFIIDGEERVVDRALIQPMILPTRQGDPYDHHAYITGQIAAHADRFIGCFVANPVLELGPTLEALRHLVHEGGFRAMKLHPTVHAYVPFRTRDRLDPLIDEARLLQIPVLVHQGDPPFAHPSQLVPLIEDFPTVDFILAHFGTQRVVLADEAIFVANQYRNVYLETSWGDLARIKEGIEVLGPRRLMFGSDCPINEIGTQLRTIEVLGWDPPMGIALDKTELEGILGDNLLALLAKTDKH